MALALWTFAHLVLGMFFFGFALMGDCVDGDPNWERCRAIQHALPAYLIIGEVIVYAVLTWALFIRRWRKQQ
ncbi:hypothetical protein ACFFV8_19125 [Sphingobium indicum]|nr:MULTISPECIES: hypothetical protein [Sphingobium]